MLSRPPTTLSSRRSARRPRLSSRLRASAPPPPTIWAMLAARSSKAQPTQPRHNGRPLSGWRCSPAGWTTPTNSRMPPSTVHQLMRRWRRFLAFCCSAGGRSVGLVAGAVVVGGLPVCAGTGVLGAEIGGIATVCFKSPLLPFFGVLIDGRRMNSSTASQGARPSRISRGDDGDAGEIVFVFCLHDTLPARRQIKKTGRAPLYCSRARPVC